MHDIGVRILRGELRPGDSLAGEFDEQDVSRTVVREAVKVLAAKGLIVSRPKTGTHVRERRYWHMLDPDVLAWRLEADPGDDFYMAVFETRRLIEPAVAALAATRASDDEVAELEAAYARMVKAVGNDQAAYIEADIRFHELILEGCHNELLTHLGSTLRGVFRATFTRTQGIAEETLPLHEAVLEGIREGDADAAEAATLGLIETTAASLAAR
ncbi:MAG TPA: FCD domain-containing protein [Gaiellaceae bacterium]|nr:FCD domain-containing protein [Gaiellaceae bacterium]